MNNEIARNDSYAASPLDQRMTYARTLSAAGSLIPVGLCDDELRDNGRGVMLPVKVPNPGKVLLVLETGSMLGVHPVAALQGVHIIEGKATISPALMSAVVRRAGHKLQVETRGSVANGDFAAKAVLVRRDDPEHPFVVVWDRPRAERAGLLNKGPWTKYFEAMCKARAISEVCREGATDALMGVGYMPEELGADVDEQGEIVLDASLAQETRQAPAEPSASAATTESAPAPSNASQASAPQAASASQPVVTQPKQTATDWRAEADAAMTADAVLQIFNRCRDAGELGQTTDVDGEPMQLRVYLRKRGETLRAKEAEKDVREDEIVEAEIVDDTPGVLDETLNADPRTGELPERDQHTTGGAY